MWLIQNNELTNDAFIELEPYLEKSYPLSLWRTSPTKVNDTIMYQEGTPYTALMAELEPIEYLANFISDGSDYPYIEGLDIIPVLSDPKPLGLFSIDNGYPYYEGLKLINVFEDPKPLGLFQIQDSYPFLEGRKLIKVLEKPYPLGVPIIEDGKYPKYDNLNLTPMEAGHITPNLTKIEIPPTVKYIGSQAFTFSSLTDVTLSEDCMYFSTSFPEGCKINLYKPEEVIL